MDERDKILTDFLSELGNEEPVDCALFTSKVVSKIAHTKARKAERKASAKRLIAIVSVLVAFLAMIYSIIFVYFKVDPSVVSTDNISLTGIFNLSGLQKFADIWKSGGYVWALIGINALILLMLQHFFSKKIERYNETKSISSSENSRLKL